MDDGLAQWAARIAAHVPRATYWVAERMNDTEIGIAVVVKTEHGPHRFSVRFPDNPTEDQLKEAAMNLNGRIEQHAGVAVA